MSAFPNTVLPGRNRCAADIAALKMRRNLRRACSMITGNAPQHHAIALSSDSNAAIGCCHHGTCIDFGIGRHAERIEVLSLRSGKLRVSTAIIPDRPRIICRLRNLHHPTGRCSTATGKRPSTLSLEATSSHTRISSPDASPWNTRHSAPDRSDSHALRRNAIFPPAGRSADSSSIMQSRDGVARRQPSS